jgi:two-component system CheB/CheR fusion protein
MRRPKRPKKAAKPKRARSASRKSRSAHPSVPAWSDAPLEGAGSTGGEADGAAPAEVEPADCGVQPLLRDPLTVVGVGASAGGLDAFSQLLAALPPDLGMAIVLVQHLAPQHESALPVLLSGVSSMPVVQVSEGVRVQANHVYVIPPNMQMEIADGELHLNPRPSDRTQYTPVDVFLRSLADSVRERAIAVILSGTASDGASGVREVKAAGGIAFAQRPDTAKYDGMPRAAIGTGLVDLVLSPQEIATQLAEIARHPFVEIGAGAQPDRGAIGEEHLGRIFALLRTATGVDFRHYKVPTILRRLQRRMALQKLPQIAQYVKFMQETPAEVSRLYQDLLIHVTRFFREPESFEALSEQVFPKILASRRGDSPIRIWVCGCATGEEAYSVAIALLEFLGDQARTTPIQIFATDVSESAIEHARIGRYAEGITADLSPERLRRYFTKTDGSYRVTKQVRDLCVFARQDLTRDPPFSKLDLILCRNVLIYMNASLQRKLMSVFHYALKPSGYLMLGHSETIGGHSDLFAIAEKKHRIYAKRLTEARGMGFSMEYAVATPASRKGGPAARDGSGSLQQEANRAILDRYAPCGVVVDSEFQIVQFRGQTGPYLEPAPGDPSMSVLKMAREGLLYGLRTAMHSARKRSAVTRREGLRVKSNGGWHDVNLEVIPLTSGERGGHFLVLFEEVPARAPAAKRGDAKRAGAKGKQSAGLFQLRQELAANREHLQAIIQELEAANEELQSANEEILSSNEELQSTNEELDTAKEELQSTNEELNTVNEELHGRNEELLQLNSDLVNLLASVEIAIVIVSSDLRIRRFTPMAERVLNLIPSDVGRPIGHIKPNIDCDNIEQLIHSVVDRVAPEEREVTDRDGKWFSLRVRPYKNVDNRIDGAVLTLFDVDAARHQDEALRAAREVAHAIVDAVADPVVLLDDQTRIQAANRSFCAIFGLSPDEIEGRRLFELSDGALDVDDLRTQLAEHFRGAGTADLSFQIKLDGNARRLQVNGRRFETVGGQPLVLLAMQHGARERDES